MAFRIANYSTLKKGNLAPGSGQNVDLMTLDLAFRRATIDDVDHLVVLLDAASRRLVSWYWSTLSELGQSYFEVGRNRIRTNPESPTYYAKWYIAELEGRIVGALNGYSIAKPYDPGDISQWPDVYKPMIERAGPNHLNSFPGFLSEVPALG
jgi:hypothetical protein